MEDHVDKFLTVINRVFAMLAKTSLSYADMQNVYGAVYSLVNVKCACRELLRFKCYVFIMYSDVIAKVMKEFDKDGRLGKKVKEFYLEIDGGEFKEEKEAIYEKYVKIQGEEWGNNNQGGWNEESLFQTENERSEDERLVKEMESKDGVIKNEWGKEFHYQPNQDDLQRIKKFYKESSNKKNSNVNYNFNNENMNANNKNNGNYYNNNNIINNNKFSNNTPNYNSIIPNYHISGFNVGDFNTNNNIINTNPHNPIDNTKHVFNTNNIISTIPTTPKKSNNNTNSNNDFNYNYINNNNNTKNNNIINNNTDNNNITPSQQTPPSTPENKITHTTPLKHNKNNNNPPNTDNILSIDPNIISDIIHKTSQSHEKKQPLPPSERRFQDFLSLLTTSPSILSFIENSLIQDNDIYKYFKDFKELSPNVKLPYLSFSSLFFPFLTKTQKKEILNILDKHSPCASYLTLKPFFFPLPKSDILRDLLKRSLTNTKYDIKKETEYKQFFEIASTEDIISKYHLYLYYTTFTRHQYSIQFNEVELKIRQMKFVLMTLMILSEWVPMIGKERTALIKGMALYRNYVMTNLNCAVNDVNHISEWEDGKMHVVDELFGEEDFEFRRSILETIRMFYNVKSTSEELLLISNQGNMNFVFKIIERNYRSELYNKNQSIKEIKNMKVNTLKCLEKEIRDLYIKQKLPLKYNASSKCYDSFEIPSRVKHQFNSLYQKIKLAFMDYGCYFELYPFGSITEFLNSETSDLDIYLDIANDYEYKSIFLERLKNYITENIDRKCRKTISSRVCVIHFTYENNLEIDISCLGYCPFLHSNLYRAYSLMDARYSILIICIKEIISILNIKNNDENKYYLNSFCWTMLLTSFLQEIINPPILPKLMENTKLIKEKVCFAGKQKLIASEKSFFNFFNNISEEQIQIPYDKSFSHYKKVYEEHIKYKNKMSIGEILLCFLEFIAYFYKPDSLYISGSYPVEGIKHLSTIHHIKEEDSRFYNYYMHRYKKYKKYTVSGMNVTDGVFLFREPFDGGYNPGQSLKDEAKHSDQSIKNTFYTRIIIANQVLSESGSFKKLKETISKLNK